MSRSSSTPSRGPRSDVVSRDGDIGLLPKNGYPFSSEQGVIRFAHRRSMRLRPESENDTKSKTSLDRCWVAAIIQADGCVVRRITVHVPCWELHECMSGWDDALVAVFTHMHRTAARANPQLHCGRPKSTGTARACFVSRTITSWCRRRRRRRLPKESGCST